MTPAERRTGVSDRAAEARALAEQIELERGHHALFKLTALASSDPARPLANEALKIIEEMGTVAEDHGTGGDTAAALEAFVRMTERLVDLLGPFAGPV
jgi:hypothetical protein